MLKKHAVKHFRNGFLKDFCAENFCIEKFLLNVSPPKKEKLRNMLVYFNVHLACHIAEYCKNMKGGGW